MKIITKNTKGVEPITDQNVEGKILVLRATNLNRGYKTAKNQLWRATGGFGCNPSLRGKAIFCTALSDNEQYRWLASEFIGIVSEEFAKQIINEKHTV